VWDKRYITAPCMAISRIHETVSIHTKKTGIVRCSKIPYVEQKQHDIESIVNDIKRIKSALKNKIDLTNIISFLEGAQLYKDIHMPITEGMGVTVSTRKATAPRSLQTLNSILNDMREKSIITIRNNHYGLSHPTEKPVRLAERILALISDPGDTIYDSFMGSGSFGVGCINTGRKYIGSEMKKEYFDIACKRIKEAVEQEGLFKETA